MTVTVMSMPADHALSLENSKVNAGRTKLQAHELVRRAHKVRATAGMSALLEAVEHIVREVDVPDPFRAIVRAGWTSEGDAQLLSALHSGYSGPPLSEFGDVIHYEAAVNGRGMMDYDTPESDPEA